MEVPTFQSRLSAMPVRAQFTLQQALAGLAAQAPNEKADKPMLLKLAEHVAIRFALDSYERGPFFSLLARPPHLNQSESDSR